MNHCSADQYNIRKVFSTNSSEKRKFLLFILISFNFINNENYNSNYCNQYVALNFCSKYSHSNLNENSLIKSRDSYDGYKYRFQSLSSSFAKFLIVIIILPSCVEKN